MRKHLGLHKQSSTVPKPWTAMTAMHCLAACTCVAHEGETTETELLKKHIHEIQAQVDVMQTTTSHKAKSNHSETAEIDTLKRQIADIQAQVADMRPAAHETKNDRPEAAEIMNYE